MNKKMKTFISLSVFLNVLLVGIILGGVSGGFSKHHFDRGHKSEQMEQRLSRILAVLPAEKNALFKQRLNELKVLKRTDKEQMKFARRNILQVFEQEPFDKVAYQHAVQALNQLHQTQMDKRVSLLADVGEYLSPKERRQLSSLIMKRGERK
ncbi:hypothetical protein OLEAN_C08450 [Oleispira antarctica RB-8]|uniref:Signaling pathway modulator ZraP n=1 Tax=Oleispira antarctica RB-8 TaxID=698738 RepID=R4YKH0_OLEAN|nr:hypothetical protein OLEAN_C08450 [Oleispira antarctica RB-8]|tara:strand:+ start:1060 stop:1515 length:456 start_codon:yes stop_codon:yes gene_type:complete